MKLFLTVVALLVGLAVAGPADAQRTCGVYANMIMQLEMSYGETRWAYGFSGPSSIFEVWASAVGDRTWTLLQVYPDGAACVRASGNDWQIAPPVAPTPPGDPA